MFNLQQVCQNREVLAQFIVSTTNIKSSAKSDEQCLRGIPEDLYRDVIKAKLGKSNSSSSSSDALSLSHNKLKTEKKDSDLLSSSAIMNNDSSMGDPSDSMGFLKTIMGSTDSLDQESNEINEIAREVAKLQEDSNKENKQQVLEDRPLDNDTGLDPYITFGPGIMVNNQDIGQNVDELLQACTISNLQENLHFSKSL